MSPAEHHALPALGSGDVLSFIRGGAKALERRCRLKSIDNGWPRDYDLLADELAERSRAKSSRAMRSGLMLEAYLFSSLDEEHTWAEKGASGPEIDAARKEASFVTRHRHSIFTRTSAVLGVTKEGSRQVTEVVEIRGIWVKCRADFIWKDCELSNVECDMKRWTSPFYRTPWTTEDELLELAVERGAIIQRALYRLILEATRGGTWRSAILAIDPARDEPLDLLVEIPDHLMQAAISQVEQALDQIAAMTQRREAA